LHPVASYDRSTTQNNLKLYINENLVASSSGQAALKTIEFDSTPFLIGSGSSHELVGMSGDTNFIPSETYSGSLDEVRFYHSLRSDLDSNLMNPLQALVTMHWFWIVVVTHYTLWFQIMSPP
jgi:hypothetical protein